MLPLFKCRLRSRTTERNISKLLNFFICQLNELSKNHTRIIFDCRFQGDDGNLTVQQYRVVALTRSSHEKDRVNESYEKLKRSFLFGEEIGNWSNLNYMDVSVVHRQTTEKEKQLVTLHEHSVPCRNRPSMYISLVNKCNNFKEELPHICRFTTLIYQHRFFLFSLDTKLISADIDGKITFFDSFLFIHDIKLIFGQYLFKKMSPVCPCTYSARTICALIEINIYK